MAPPAGSQFEGLGRPEGGDYLGGSGLPEPEMTANEYLGVDDAGKLDIIRRLVREKNLVDGRELSDLIHADKRRGRSSGSRERDQVTRHHSSDVGRQAYRAGRGHEPGERSPSGDRPLVWSARFGASGEPAVVVDPAFIRPADPKAIAADPGRIETELGWQPKPGLDRFLEDMLEAKA